MFVQKEVSRMNHKTLVRRPKTQKGRETLNRILEAAAQVFYEKGYHNATIIDITTMAGVATGTFYVYFEGKHTLFEFMVSRCGRLMRRHLNEAVRGCKTRREAERAGIRAWLEFIIKNRYMYHIIWESLYVDKGLFMEHYFDFAKAYIQKVETARENGEIRTEMDDEVLVWTLMGASSFLGLNWGSFQEHTTNTDIDKLVNSFIDIISAGIFTEEKTAPPIQIQIGFDDDANQDDNAEGTALLEPPLEQKQDRLEQS